MGVKTEGGFWCDHCGRPVAGEKATHRARGSVIAATVLATGVPDPLVAARSDAFHCPNCGGRVRKASPEDFALREEDAANEQFRRREAERAAQVPDWRAIPREEVPPWRAGDRAKLEASQATSPTRPNRLVAQLRELADLHSSGALTDAEFSSAKARLLDGS